jgi:NAD-dependent dihydropyrimidine dehydrogenase PreA subunit
MNYTITDDCVLCGACAYNCPQNCINQDCGLYIDMDKCDNCKLCIEVCPVDAIKFEN